MATTIAELMATLGLDISGFDKGIDQAENKSSSLNQTMLRLSAVGGGIVAGALGTAAAGAAILGKELTNDVSAAADAQKVQAQLEAVLKSTGGVAGVTAEQADNLANSLSNVTAFDDEAIKSGESMLLTFTNIGKDVFPSATETILDMSQALGQDLQSSAIQLGKALNDPVQGVTALRRVGVQLSDEQETQVKAFMANNDIMGAQKIILGELSREFGGSAKAAGQTFGGQMTILQTKLGNIRESIGAKLLPVLGNLATTFSNYIMRPEVQKFIEDFANSISTLAQRAVEAIPRIIQTFQNIVQWFINNKPIVVGILAALGVAVMAWAVTTAIAAATAMAPFLPVIAIMAAIGAIAYVVYRAWTENWGGIQQRVQAVWTALQPVFSAIRQWLSVAIPAALAIVKIWWEGFTATLRTVWGFISTNVLPLFSAVANVIGAVLGVAIRAAAGLFQNVLFPAMQKIWSFINANVMPIVKVLAAFLISQLKPAFDGIGKAIQIVIGFLNGLATKISSLKLPSWLTPGSPTPFEIGLRGIASALSNVNSIGFNPNFAYNNLEPSGNSRSIPGRSLGQAEQKQINYHIEIHNPKGETTEESERKNLKKLSYLSHL